MRDLNVLSVFYGCTECAPGVRAMEAMLKTCLSGEATTCEKATSVAAAAATSAKTTLPLPAALPAAWSVRADSVRSMQGTYGGYTAPPPPLTRELAPLNPSPPLASAASTLVLGALAAVVALLAVLV